MLVLSRKQNEKILIGQNIRITVVGIRGSQVRIGIEAPDWIDIYREELCLPAPAPSEESPQSRWAGAKPNLEALVSNGQTPD